LGDEIARQCKIAYVRNESIDDDENTPPSRKLFSLGKEPGLSGEINAIGLEAPGEFRTVELSPLQAILVARLAELAIWGQIYFTPHVGEEYNYVRLNNHIHFSFTYTDDNGEVLNLSRQAADFVLEAAIAGLPLLISPEERESKEVFPGITPYKLGISENATSGRSFIIVRARDRGRNIPHYELRKTAYGEPKLVGNYERVFGLDPLISSMAIICAGVEHGYRTENLYSFSCPHKVEELLKFIFTPKTQALPDKNFTGYIPQHVFAKWFENMQRSPVLGKYFGRELMSQLVDAMVEQDPNLASSVLQARGR
jgi:hypothetical protein